MTDSKIEVSSLAKPRFLWWRFALMVTILALLGWGFSASWYCDPAPSGRQAAVFFLLLLVILVQTIQAGWYRNEFPWEIRYIEAIATFLKLLVLLGIGAGVVWLTMFLTPDPVVALFVIIVAFMLVLAVIEVSKSGGSGT